MHAKSALKPHPTTVTPPGRREAAPPQPPVFDPSQYVTKSLTVDDVLKLKECFDIFDYDKSGNVSADELVTAIRALGLEREAGKILQIVTSYAGEEELSFDGFLEVFGFNDTVSTDKSLQNLFEIFDQSKQGSFGIEQFAAVCDSVGERFTEAEIAQMIEFADKDKDGRINFNEFKAVVTKEYNPI